MAVTANFKTTESGAIIQCLPRSHLPELHEVNYEVAHHGYTFFVFSLDRIYVTCGRAGDSDFP